MKSTLLGLFLFLFSVSVSWAFAQQEVGQTNTAASGGGTAAGSSGPRAGVFQILRTQFNHTNHRSPEEPTKPRQKRGMQSGRAEHRR